jgi:hypothetical protein
MKTICRISGVPIWKTNDLLGFDLEDEHPLFKAKRSLILATPMIHKFNLTATNNEKKLIFLATLNATYLVDFKVSADPSLATMESNYHRLNYLAQWVNYAESLLARVVSFPQYVIREDNRDLKNIRSWLDAIDDIRVKIQKKELDRDKNALLLQREMEIKRELGEANFFGKAFTPKLAKWCLEVCDIKFQHPEYSKWIKILCTPLNEAWILNLEDLYQLQDILQMGLPNLEQNPQAVSVMFQMRSLIKECKRGFTDFTSILDSTDAQSADFEIVEETNAETHEQKTIKINQHLVGVPDNIPELKNYPTKLAYLVAKAKWDLAHKDQGVNNG